MLNSRHIPEVADADNFVAVFANDGHTRNTALEKDRHHIIDAVLGIHGDHVGAGHHDLSNNGVAEVKHRVQEFTILLLEHVALGGFIDPVSELILTRYGGGPADTRSNDVSQHHETFSEWADTQANRTDKASESSHHERCVSRSHRAGA